MKRCTWAQASVAETKYHDQEWGAPVHDDRLLFEFLILEGAQAGLSWSTILKKRQGYRETFDNFEASLIAQYENTKIQQLLNNSGIVRNKLKINSTIVNAQVFLKIQLEYGSFNQYIWQFVEEKTVQNEWQTMDEVPTSTEQSILMSKSLKKEGFKFVGETICYTFMKAGGMVNDHTVDCFRHHQIKEIK
jgi:DNA-3-methyladenine glycosylase I